MNNQTETMKLWQAIKECRELCQSVKSDVARLAQMMHNESGESITETQEGLAELAGIVLGEPAVFEDGEEETAEEGGNE